MIAIRFAPEILPCGIRLTMNRHLFHLRLAPIFMQDRTYAQNLQSSHHALPSL